MVIGMNVGTERCSARQRQVGIFVLLFFALTIFGGCSQPSTRVEVKEPTKKVVKRKQHGKVVIILSNSLPDFSNIANLLANKLGKRATIYNLQGDIRRSMNILDAIRKIDRKQVVAIGLLASQVARTLDDTQVIFCQVFNYEGLGFVSPLMKGVSINPEHALIFSTWKKIDPNIQHVAVMTGRNKGVLIEAAANEATKHGISLTHKVVKTDLDLVHAVKNLPDDIQGIWLLPDNRVLSVRAIKDIFNFSVKYAKQVVVSQPELLKLGGLFSLQGSADEIAKQTLARLKQATGKKEIPGEDVVLLKKAKISINSRMAQIMGLDIPQEYQKYTYD